jgi:CBS domain-containing protein
MRHRVGADGAAGDRQVAALAVTKDDAVLGILSEHEIALAFSRHGERLAGMTVGDILTANIVSVAPEDSLKRAMRLLTRGNAQHLLVLRDAKLAGVVDIGDVARHRFEELPLNPGPAREAHRASY